MDGPLVIWSKSREMLKALKDGEKWVTQLDKELEKQELEKQELENQKFVISLESGSSGRIRIERNSPVLDTTT
jgi:hypothetical protein